MADEIIYSGIADLRTAEALSAEILLLLADRNALPNHPALLYAGDAVGRGSSVLKVPAVGLMGYDLLSAPGDGSAVANTALTDTAFQVTVARYSKAYEASDLARLTDPANGKIKVAEFASDAVVSSSNTLVSLVANVTDNFTSTVGSSGVDLSVNNFLAAIQTLEVAKNVGPYMAILHPQQMGDLRAAIANVTGGAIQWLPASQEQIQVLGNGYRGQWMGVDIFSSSYVPTANAGADRAGGMFARGAVLWADSSIPSEGDPNQLVLAGKILFERERTAKSGLTAYVTHYYCGVSKGIDAAGVSIITDA
jgi:hypothetical protein